MKFPTTTEEFLKTLAHGKEPTSEDSYSMGYNDCLLDILREKEEVSAPIMFPTLKS